MNAKRYHVFIKNTKTGMAVQMTGYPEPHDRACTLLRALTDYKWRVKYLVSEFAPKPKRYD